MAFILDPNAATVPNPDRFVSMSVTRNASAVVPIEGRPKAVRETMGCADIEGAHPRVLPPHHRGDFHDPGDIEGARSKPLHFQKHHKPDFTTTNADIEGEQ